ncbi:MAG TPA: DmsE family decaheme c-type cytochrome [Terriglobales bacterium]|nr:DmsE family decaheme c-type cytochrome [Terriglobales bacterium]
MHFRIGKLPVLLFPILLVSISHVQARNVEQSAAPNAPARQTKDSGYVGSETCKGCHEDIYKATERTPHYKMGFQPGAPGKGVNCEACHGPGKAHVEGGGDKSKIIVFENLSMADANKRCLSCHTYGNEHANFTRSAHASNDIGCISCHSPHHPQTEKALLVEKQPQLCYQCHTEVKAEFSRPYRHRVNQGLLQCTDCHNEHGGFLPKQLRASAAQDQVCFKCHTEKKGPFVYEHLPVETEGCTSCHTPHGSTNPRLLRVSQVNLLCLQCHTLAMSNVPSQPPIGPAHNQAQKYQACTMCHAFIHGSNFSEVFFKP